MAAKKEDDDETSLGGIFKFILGLGILWVLISTVIPTFTDVHLVGAEWNLLKSERTHDIVRQIEDMQNEYRKKIEETYQDYEQEEKEEIPTRREVDRESQGESQADRGLKAESETSVRRQETNNQDILYLKNTSDKPVKVEIYIIDKHVETLTVQGRSTKAYEYYAKYGGCNSVSLMVNGHRRTSPDPYGKPCQYTVRGY